MSEADSNTVSGATVAWLDLLNQRQRLSEWDRLASVQSSREQIIEAIRGSFGAVLLLRQVLERVTGLFSVPVASDTHVTGLTPEQVAEFESIRQSKLKIFSFADTVVVHGIDRYHEGAPLLRDVIGLLFGVGAVVPCLMAEGIAVRGSIEHGHALVTPKGEIYGPAAARAYYLESEVAQYPRIVIGDGLVRWLTDLRSIAGGSVPIRSTRMFADQALSVISRDDDGAWALDYLGYAFASHKMSESYRELVPKAIHWAQAEYERFLAASDRKLTGRYALLVRYLLSRRPSWD